MDAAHASDARARGSSRLLDDCATLERPSPVDRRSARARLESELGGELLQFLIRALVGRRPRAEFLTPF